MVMIVLVGLVHGCRDHLFEALHVRQVCGRGLPDSRL